jgi:ferrous iron transport protein A
VTAQAPSPLTLADLANGARARVTSVTGEALLRERIVELGFTPGTPVVLLGRALFGGPLQVRIRGGSLAVRTDEARCIAVSLGDPA